jgi:general secretion pathway protein I
VHVPAERRPFAAIRTTGFTLVEVLVALAVLAVALAAVTHSVSLGIDLSADLRDRNVALWVAQNRLVQHQAQRDFPAPDTTEGTIDMAGRTWRWREQVANTPEQKLRRIEIDVRSKDQDHVLARLVGFLAQP